MFDVTVDADMMAKKCNSEKKWNNENSRNCKIAKNL